MAKRIHIIDDDKDIVSAIETILSMEGYEVRYSYSGEESINVVKESIPDLILLDYMLPDMTGRQVSDILKAAPKIQDTPIILLSAAHGVRDIAESMKIQGCIEKPFELDVLLATINEKLKDTKNTSQ